MTLRKWIEQQLSTANLGFKEVLGAAGLGAVMNGRISMPGCYVFRENTRAAQNGTLGIVSQDVWDSMGIVIITRNVTDAKGSDSSDENEHLSNLVQATILGVEPPGYGPIEYEGGTIMSFNNSVLAWHDSYRAQRVIRSQQ